MSGNSIFDEAILDAKKLREVAEANARNVLIEAVTPRVRELIERQLLGEDAMIGEEEDEEYKEGEGEEVILDLDTFKDASGGSEGPHDPGVESDDLDERDEFLLSKESVAALLALTDGQPVTSAEVFKERLNRVRKGLSFAQDLSESVASEEKGGRALLSRLLTKMLREAKTLRDEVIRIGGKDPTGSITPLNEEIQKILKEIVDMASRKQLMKESTEMFEIDLAELGLSEDGYAEGDYMESDYMAEEDEDMDMEDMDMDMDPEEDDAGDMIEIPDDLLTDPQVQQLLDLLTGAGGAADEDMDMDLPAEEDEEDEEDEAAEEDDEVVEIDEGMLRRELARMRANLSEADGAQDPDVLEDFGGAKVDKEVFVDGDDSDLNVHAEVRQLRKQVQNESRQNRALRRQLSGFKQVHAELKEQLEQMNLFNAKLLYVNKLMNKDSLTTRQKKAVVEALDKAQTLREVRLLYKTLSESLDRRQKKGSINESAARRAGSASRVTRPGSSPQGASEQPDRWAVLAGISKDSK